LLHSLVKALENDQLDSARQFSKQLDQMAGSHIEFEETELYPLVALREGEAYVEQLLDEHRQAQGALKRLVAMKDGETPARTEYQEITDNLRVGLKHAGSCGTLVSCLTTLPEDRQQTIVRRLQELRATGRRWSELNQAL
jgi:hypothetical protein